METLTIIALVFYIAYKEYHTAKERKDLIKAIMSKNLTEYVTSDIIKPKKQEAKKPADIIPAELMTNEDFENMIKKQLSDKPPVVESLKQKVAKTIFKKNG